MNTTFVNYKTIELLKKNISKPYDNYTKFISKSIEILNTIIWTSYTNIELVSY